MNTHRGIPVARGVIYCQHCGFAHLDPLPTTENVQQYYDNDLFYATHSPPDWLQKELSEYQRGVWFPFYDYLAGLIAPGKRVIDIGCGAGWLIGYLHQKYGYNVYGIEPSEAARQISPFRQFLYKDVSQLAGIRGNVILSLTLEHITNPLEFLKRDVVPRLNGRLIVVVPNEFNPLQRRINRGKHTDWFVAPVHINYFTGMSLKALLHQAGLKVVDVGATFPMELFILFGLDYRGDDKLGRECHRARLTFDRLFGPMAYWLYRRFYRQWGWGRELIMVAEKL